MMNGIPFSPENQYSTTKPERSTMQQKLAHHIFFNVSSQTRFPKATDKITSHPKSFPDSVTKVSAPIHPDQKDSGFGPVNPVNAVSQIPIKFGWSW
jgi:hypothetical protein